MLTRPCATSAMFGLGGTAARVEIVLETRPPAPPAAQRSIAAPSRTGGPAAGMIGFRNLIPAISTVRFAISWPPRVRMGGCRSAPDDATGVGAGYASAATAGSVHAGRPPVEDDRLAGDDDVPDNAAAEAEHPVAGQRRGVHRRDERVVKDDRVCGRAGFQASRGAARRTLPPATRAPCARRSSGHVAECPDILLAATEVRRPTFLEHVGADAVRPERDPLPEARKRGPPTLLFMFERGVMDDGRARCPDDLHLLLVEVDAVCEERASVDRTGCGEPRGDPDAESRLGIRFVRPILGDVDVDPDTVPMGEIHAGRQRFLRQGERGMRADHAPSQRTAPGRDRREEPGILVEACPCDRRPIAITRFVAQHRPDARVRPGRRPRCRAIRPTAAGDA